MWTRSNEWVNWFNTQNFSTPTEYFLYLIDESGDYPLIEKWAGWMETNPGVGKQLMSFATLPAPAGSTLVPSLDIAASWTALNVLGLWEGASDYYHEQGRRLYMYNGDYAERGSFATEDEGIALRVQSWAQYKKKIHRWFAWESTYYNYYQSGMGRTNVFQSARTFGTDTSFQENHPARGRTGWNYTNGDGVLFYPGTELQFPNENYEINGPIASLRLKLWRRGIQDTDYLELASQINKPAVDVIIDRLIPKVLWEFGAGESSDPNDPTWVCYDPNRQNDPDVWEAARAQLADIIEGGGGGSDTEAPTIPKNLNAMAASSTQINLSWTASTDNVVVTGYRIYRGGTVLTTTIQTSYSDTGLSASTAYTYNVTAYDAAANQSVQSSSASTTTQAGGGSGGGGDSTGDTGGDSGGGGGCFIGTASGR